MWSFRWIILTGCTLLANFSWAQDSSRSKWLPDYAKLQYAGNIGFFSVGVGYENKKGTLEGDFFYGYVPESVGGVTIHTVTSKLNWHTFGSCNSGSYKIKPFTVGVLASYTFGKQYFGFSPENYPYDYYKFPTAFHAGVLVGGQANKRLGGNSSIRKIGLYYELLTFDTEFLSYLNNTHALRLSDVVSMSLGLKLSFK